MSQKREDSAAVNRHTVRRLLRYAKPYIGWFLLTLAIILATVGLELYQPEILERAADDYVGKYVQVDSGGLSVAQLREIRSEDIRGVVRLGVTYLLTVLGIMVLSYSQTRILATVGQRIIYNLRTDIFNHLTRLHIGFYNDNPIGRLVTRVTNDCETVNEMFTSVITNIISSIFVLIGVMVTMLRKSVRLSLMVFLVIPFIVIFTLLFTKVTRKLYRAIRARISELNAFVAEHVSGMKVVQIFTAEDNTLKEFKDQSEELRKANIRQLMCFALYSPTSYLLNIASMAILLGFGGKMVISGVISVGVIIAFQRYVTKFFDPIQELAENFNVIQSAAAAAERIFWLMDTEPQIQDDPEAVHMDHFQGRGMGPPGRVLYRGARPAGGLCRRDRRGQDHHPEPDLPVF